jgi:hypothetical protein
MLEIIFIGFVLFIILTLFYKQAICEFRINQVEWEKRDTLHELLQEKIPLVLRGIPSSTCWSHNDVIARECYSRIPIFKETTLSSWISSSAETAICPWSYPQAEQIARISGIPIWAEKWLHPVVIPRALRSWWIHPRYHCWTGRKGLHRTYAMWTCIFPVDGEIQASILTESMESNLPTSWMDRMPDELSLKDTPFIHDLKYMDVILRPGTCFILPPHWFVSWKPTETSSIPPMVCSISYHTPISLLAFHSSPCLNKK